MCRIFGFRSVILSQVHHSLISADNALMNQSEKHPDGWGVAYYVSDAPHIVKSGDSAMTDSLFKKVSGIVSSETVVAHIRKATLGENTILNTHPFQFGKWVFVHNGNIKNFNNFREELIQKISPKFRRFILGETDSEVLFYYILTHLSASLDLHRKGLGIEDIGAGVQSALAEIKTIIGEYHTKDDGPPDETYLTFLLTNGESMIAHQGGKNLFYSTYKTACGVRDSCPSYGYECENATQTGYINHLIFSSEPLSGENVWLPMTTGQLIGADWSMKLTTFDSP